jgi:hypothetical protein
VTLSVRRYEEADADLWDRFCTQGLQATFLHSRRFLSYHGNRFEDASLLIQEDDDCLGVFPAARSPADPLTVISHPGSSYGGVVHQGALRGEPMLHAIKALCRHLAGQGYAQLLYKAVPAIYHRAPSQDDLYALFRLDARRVRCDLSSAIDLSHRLPVSNRRLRGLKKAIKSGVKVVSGLEYLSPLWEVLSHALKSKYDTEPVHDLAEITLLAERFPDEIQCVCGVLEDRVVAGVILFVMPDATHAQYITSSEMGYQTSALDLVFDACIESSVQDGKRWFDFGISNERGGRYLNEGLYEFKSNFGGGGIVHEFYQLDLIEGVWN